MLANADEGLSAVPQTYPIKEVSQVKIIQSILLRSNTPIISLLHRPDLNLDQLIAKIYPNLDE
jgi:hypothetical protein